MKEKLNPLQQQAYEVVTNTALTHEQATNNLSGLVGADAPVLALPEGFEEMHKEGLLCTMSEGTMPYAPRYLLPDYEKLMREGCEFLRLAPPQNLFEAIQALEIFYRHVPSVTHYPVYLGSVDELLEPFIENEEEAKYLIKQFMFFISRSIPDSYCHMNIGPTATRAGHYILDAEIELQQAIPSITLLYDAAITPDDFAEKALQCALLCAKPSFANHAAYKAENAQRYGIASCYNALPVGGGSFTLSRVMISRLAQKAQNSEEFFDVLLPRAVAALCGFMEEKIRFIVEESHFFRSNFLVKEGFLKLENFTAMVGIVGLNECVNTLMEKDGAGVRYGHGKDADELGQKVMEALQAHVEAFCSKYCDVTGHHFVLHAQVGIDSDTGISPGARIAIGNEPELYDHLRHAGLFHGYFPSGVGDIFPFEDTAQNNPAAILDIVKGGFEMGMRYFSTYSSNSDVVRVTGYLVKKSDMEKLAGGEAVAQANATWGLGAVRNSRVLERKVRTI